MNGFNKRLEALFEATVALDTEAERVQYLTRECPDPELRREVESLVACHHHPDPIFAQDQRGDQPLKASSPNDLNRYVGQTLDEKYRLDRFLGQGGMGAVYLSTHLGTGRYVAVKLIAPEYVRHQEFFHRFKREARAAGRLRHPNIVDVTDFGVAQVAGDRVAYLVMEYLDGCSLSDVLAEEKQLPLPWVVDLLEQVCSAVGEAHQLGIIHRDLKPANIWLEPNALGGYRVKVLDFGVAKLADAAEEDPGSDDSALLAPPTDSTCSSVPSTNHNSVSSGSGQGSTDSAANEPGLETVLDNPTDPSSPPGEGLTRVGAILGTPAYMSPEQCRGQALDARSDIYSLGIIAYQMLAGTLPFSGGTAALLQAHQSSQPIPLHDSCKKVPKPVSRLIMSALEKDPEARPATAMAFAKALRANAEDLGALYRRAFSLYSEYFPQVMKISLLAHIPVIVMTFITIILTLNGLRFPSGGSISLEIIIGLMKGAATFVTGSVISGMITIIMVGLAAAPLKPVTLNSSFSIVKRRLGPLLKTGLQVTLRILIGMVFFIIPGFVLMVRYSLWTPVVFLEGRENASALRRARELAARSWSTSVPATLFHILVPVLFQWVMIRIIRPGSGGNDSVQMNSLLEFASLGSIFIMPMVSIVVALVYLKMRQLGGEPLSPVLPQIETASQSQWEQRIQARLSGRSGHV